jgi:hypothetical protein
MVPDIQTSRRNSIPLTGRQKLRLLGDCWTFALFAAITIFFVMAVQRGLTPAPPTLTYVLLAALVLYTAYGAVQSLRDVKSGMALAQEDLLIRSHRRRLRRGGYGIPFGYFEQLGAMRLPPEVYSQHSAGRRYLVIYSPASKVVWSLEPPEERSR